MIFSKPASTWQPATEPIFTARLFVEEFIDQQREARPDRGGPLVVGVDELGRRGTEICASARYSELSAWTVQAGPTLP
jgi:hypothetical protein